MSSTCGSQKESFQIQAKTSMNLKNEKGRDHQGGFASIKKGGKINMPVDLEVRWKLWNAFLDKIHQSQAFSQNVLRGIFGCTESW
jgi:hypothetical protein